MSDEAAHESTQQEPTHQPQQTSEVASGGVGDFVPSGLASAVLAHPAIGGRGNGPARVAAIQRLQATYGNRSVSRFLQRTAASTMVQPTGDVGSRIQARAGAGAPLDSGVQGRLETGLGADLSGVRVHTDGEADHLSRSVDAVAFTTGSDIFFRSGAYNPASSEGLHLLAHEATHTVQQAAGPVAGTPVGGGVAVSDPSDSFEQAAERSAAAVTAEGPVAVSAGASPAGGVAAQRQVTGRTIQRYQAGETGHGGIEERALGAAGFSAAETAEIYFGNWSRDLSQLPPGALPIVNLLALGEFNREVTAAELGTYVASEHLDNPDGGGTVEDPHVYALRVSTDPLKRAEFQAALAKLSPAQRAAYDREEAHRKDILTAAANNHLPEYIERGKMHIKDKLTEALKVGPTPDGHRQMGDALHAVEDYFSHSNYVEACIYILHREGNAAVAPLYTKLSHTHLGVNTALAAGPPDAQGRLGIVTGTYAGKANGQVSQLELLKTELQNGALRKALALGILRKAGITGEQVGRTVGRYTLGVGMGATSAVSGGVAGTVTGAGHGAAAGWRRHSGVSAVGHAITGLFSGAAEGAVAGAEQGWDEGERAGQTIMGAEGRLAAMGAVELAGIVARTSLAVLEIEFPIITAGIAGAVALADKVLIDVIAENQTNASGGEARAAGLAGPTHSELAKDAPDHQLFSASVKLAETADREIGAAMRAAWGPGTPAAAPAGHGAAPTHATTPTPANSTAHTPANSMSPATAHQNGATATTPAAPGAVTDPAVIKRVTDLVDKFVSNPSDNGWWRGAVP